MTLKMNRSIKLSILAAALNLIGIVFVQYTADLPYQIRFSSTALNYWLATGMVLLIPILLFLVSRQLQGVWVRGVVITFMVLLTIPCLVMFGCDASVALNKHVNLDDTYRLISQGYKGSLSIKLYQTDCVYGCERGLALSEERNLFLGLKLVTPLWSKQDVSEGRVVVEKSTVSVLRGTEVLVVLPR